MRRLTWLAITLGAAVVAGAQLPTVAPDTRLRVGLAPIRDEFGIARGGDYKGTLLAQTIDSLTLTEGRSTRRAIPASRVSEMAVSLGKTHGAGARKGAWIGGGVGCLLGILGGVGAQSFNDSPGSTNGGIVVGAAAGSTVFGALVGAGIGSLIRAEGWRTIYRRR